MTSLENIFIQIPNFVFMKDLHSKYIGCNANFALSTGRSKADEVVGITDFDMPWRDTGAELCRIGDQEVLDKVPIVNTLETIRNKNGEIITIQINKVPMLNERREIVGVIGSYMEYIPNQFRGDFDDTKINIPLSTLHGNILFELAVGNSLSFIADKMGLSIHQLAANLEELKTKLRCRNLVELTNKALSISFIKSRIFGVAKTISYQFTRRETDILRLTIKCKTAREVALALGLSNRTVENYLVTIKEKVGVTSKSALILKLLESNFE